MKPAFFSFHLPLLAWLIAADILLALLIDPDWMPSIILENPAQGEEAANRNLRKMFLVILPSIQLLGYGVAKVFLDSLGRKSANVVVPIRIALATLVFAYAGLVANLLMNHRTNSRSVLYLSVALTIYLGLFVMLSSIVRRVRSSRT